MATRSPARRSPIPLSDERLGRPLGDVLLEPTTIYVHAVLELLESGLEIQGLAHITADGLNNLLRLSAEVGYQLTDPLEAPPVFELIASEGRVNEEEMYEVSSMGLGFVCVVPEDDVDAAVELLASRHAGTRVIERVTQDAGKVERSWANRGQAPTDCSDSRDHEWGDFVT